MERASHTSDREPLTRREVLSRGAKAFALFVAGGAALVPQAETVSAPSVFPVQAGMPGWQGPACWAEKGRSISFRARGRWTADVAARPYVGPGGYAQKRGAFPLGALVAQIGCHTDDLSKKEHPQRPAVVVEKVAVGEAVRLSPRFGGLVYFYINDGSTENNAGTMEVRVEGGVAAPVLGPGSPALEGWPASIESLPAPWGELQGNHMAFALPVEQMRKVKDPAKLMRWWDSVYLHYCELDGRAPSVRKTRYVPDVGISTGFMHAGDPIMYKMVSIPLLIDMDDPRFPQWGFLHELGHNFQRSVYDFAGMSEVSCNIFTLYGFHMMGMDQVVDGKRKDGARRKQAYLQGGARFEDWRKSPFLALYTFIELMDGFGWDPFKSMFRYYWALAPGTYPRTDGEKRDLFMVVMSRCVGRNLGPFFRQWGIPISPQARAAVRALSPWTGPAANGSG